MDIVLPSRELESHLVDGLQPKVVESRVTAKEDIITVDHHGERIKRNIMSQVPLQGGPIGYEVQNTENGEGECTPHKLSIGLFDRIQFLPKGIMECLLVKNTSKQLT